jgi:hypothetical protein
MPNDYASGSGYFDDNLNYWAFFFRKDLDPEPQFSIMGPDPGDPLITDPPDPEH